MKNLFLRLVLAFGTAAMAVGPAPASASRIVVVWNNTAHCAMVTIFNPVGSPAKSYHMVRARGSIGEQLLGTVKVQAEIMPGAACSGARIAMVDATHPMNYRNPETAHALTAEISGSNKTFSIRYF